MKNNNQINVPQAREAGSVGGQMVKNVKPVRNMMFERKSRIARGNTVEVGYTYGLTV